MVTAKIEYLGDLRTSATHLRSGNTIITDAPIDNQGKGEAFSPTDLAAAALGSCMVTIMGIAAQKHDIDMVGATVSITKEMASDPRRIGGIRVEMQMPTKDYSSKHKKILLAAAKDCPVFLSLHPDMEIDIQIIW